MSGESVQKILFMGLGASGKSSIRSVVFEGKAPNEVKDYNATINYTRSTKNIIDSAFQIFDCGGQESFISVFIGEQAEFIASDRRPGNTARLRNYYPGRKRSKG